MFHSVVLHYKILFATLHLLIVLFHQPFQTVTQLLSMALY